MPLKTVLVLTLMVLAGAAGDVLLSKGMKQVGEITSAQPAELLRAGVRAARNPTVVAGVLALAVYFFSFSIVLSWADVSLVVPISALSFLLTTFVAQRALGEHVTAQRWCGTVLIVIGVVLVARSQAPASPADGPAPGAQSPAPGNREAGAR
jgi:drug/metabolite transporter (DMT)-like permease